jgi:hypothetical protein
MKRLLVALLIIAGTMLGCAQNHFNVPAENIAEKVRVLGVAPIFLDADSDIIYPQKEFLIPMVTEFNRKYENLLVNKIKNTGSFYAVTLQLDEPKPLFSALVARREKRDDAGIQYNKYFWKNDEIAAYIKKNRLDAVMVVVVNGFSRTSNIYSSSLVTSAESNYNYLMMSAQILGVDGTVLWEYPNFRGRFITSVPLINLQYPDFSEAEANLSRKVEVHYKTLDGIRRTLEQKRSDWLLRETQEPESYGKLFDEMVALIRFDGSKGPKEAAEENKSAPLSSQQPKTEYPKPEPTAPATVAPEASPVKVPAPLKSPAPPAGVSAPPTSNEIVPATGSTK